MTPWSKMEQSPKHYVGYGLEYLENGNLKVYQSGYIAAYVKENNIEVGNRDTIPYIDEAMKKAEEDHRMGNQK